MPAPQPTAALQSVHPEDWAAQVWRPPDEHCVAPTVHGSVHEATHAPPEQVWPAGHGTGAAKEAQPEAAGWQTWISAPEHCAAPSVQASAQPPPAPVLLPEEVDSGAPPPHATRRRARAARCAAGRGSMAAGDTNTARAGGVSLAEARGPRPPRSARGALGAHRGAGRAPTSWPARIALGCLSVVPRPGPPLALCRGVRNLPLSLVALGAGILQVAACSDAGPPSLHGATSSASSSSTGGAGTGGAGAG